MEISLLFYVYCNKRTYFKKFREKKLVQINISSSHVWCFKSAWLLVTPGEIFYKPVSFIWSIDCVKSFHEYFNLRNGFFHVYELYMEKVLQLSKSSISIVKKKFFLSLKLAFLSTCRSVVFYSR